MAGAKAPEGRVAVNPRIESRLGLRGQVLVRFIPIAISLTLAVGCQSSGPCKPVESKDSPRAQLSIGYSLLYQEASGIPKMKWILMFKDKPEEMGRITNDQVSYYQQLAGSMERLSRLYPAMRIDVAAMSKIESDEREAIGTDELKDFSPVIGKTGVEFQRETLLMFYNALDEQRHLTGVMIGLETNPGLRTFLETTNGQLEVRYGKVGALLNGRYFTH